MKKLISVLRGALKKFWRYYVKGEYHCNKCPFGWDIECSHGEYPTEWDCGCYIKGDVKETCRLLPPVRFLLGWGRRKKATYIREHEYDDFPAWAEKKDLDREAVRALLKEYFDLSDEGINGVRMDIFADDVKGVFVAPGYIPLKTRWKALLKETVRSVLSKVKPYFSK